MCGLSSVALRQKSSSSIAGSRCCWKGGGVFAAAHCMPQHIPVLPRIFLHAVINWGLPEAVTPWGIPACRYKWGKIVEWAKYLYHLHYHDHCTHSLTHSLGTPHYRKYSVLIYYTFLLLVASSALCTTFLFDLSVSDTLFTPTCSIITRARGSLHDYSVLWRNLSRVLHEALDIRGSAACWKAASLTLYRHAGIVIRRATQTFR